MGEQAADRFWARVDRAGACWRWTGAHHPKGYGLVKRAGRLQVAHRVAWALTHGTQPAGTLKRTCPTVGCVRPDHYRHQAPPAPAGRRRLPRGAGHIRQRSPESFTVEIFAGTDPLDRRRKQRVTFTVPDGFDDAVAAAEEFRAHARTGDRFNLAADGSFGELLDRWMAHARLEASTRRTYQGYIENHIKPALGQVPLRGTTADAVRNELATGQPTGGTFHFEKAAQYSTALNNLLKSGSLTQSKPFSTMAGARLQRL